MDCNRTRTERLTLRMSAKEKEFLQSQKEKSQCSTFVEFILKSVSETIINVLDTTPLLEISAELNKIGVNINQIAKIANSTGNITPERIQYLRNEIDRMEFMIDNIIECYTPKKE
jgi:uncharacterized protein (DUF1778 family)